MDYTGKRLIDLENETTGELSRKITTVGGWSVITYPNGEITATCELDYTASTDFEWTEISFATISENIPSGIFLEVTNSDCMVIDITPSSSNKSSMGVSRKSLPGILTTGEFTINSLEYSFGEPNYSLPTKIHIKWTVKGLK